MLTCVSCSARRWLTALLGLNCVLVATGCGDSPAAFNASVQGTVTVDGHLAERGSVAFHPVGKGPIAVGSISQDGSYTVRVGQGNLSDPDGGMLPSGDYIATVTVDGKASGNTVAAEGGPPLPGPRLSAQKYASKSTSGLTHTIQPGKNVIVLNLEGAAADAPLVEEPTAAVEDAEASHDAPRESDGDEDTDAAPQAVEESAESSPAPPSQPSSPVAQ